MSNRKSRVVILGGGFGGLYAALEFEKRNDPRFEVTLVNRENFFLFTPILGVNFSGFLAWFLWRGIYWSKLPRAEKKVWRSLGRWMSFSPKISCSISISARWPRRKLKLARRRGIAT